MATLMAVYFDFEPRLRELGRDLEWLAAESCVAAERVEEHQRRRAEGFTWDELERYCRALGCQPGRILKRHADEKN